MSSESEQDDTRREIMGATYRALCKHGYANLTMQDIADEFDKSKSLLHYHYDTKDDLMLAFLDHVIGWIGDRLEESETEEPLDRLREYLDRFVIKPGEEEESFSLALLELRLQAVHHPGFREKLQAHYESNVETAARILDDGIEEEVFKPVDTHAVAEMLYTSMTGASAYQVTLGASQATTSMRDALLRFVVTDLLVEPADGRIETEVS